MHVLLLGFVVGLLLGVVAWGCTKLGMGAGLTKPPPAGFRGSKKTGR
jgi:hypothetical protein